MDLTTRVRRHRLPLEAPFEIARGSATRTTTVTTVELRTAEGTVGVGAASPSTYYDDDPSAVDRALPDLLEVVTDADSLDHPTSIERRCRQANATSPSALAAVSIAVHDLAARHEAVPLYRRWGLDPGEAPRTSLTVGIADPGAMAERAERAIAAGFESLKVKLGTPDDRRRLRAVREAAPDATLRVDANGAWAVSEAIEHCEWLSALDVALLEQPVAGTAVSGLAAVADATAIPVAADEACVTAADVPRVADAADLVVVKLMKCGGIGPARRQVAAAHLHGLDVMLGCMVESAASIAPACHLAPLAEAVDLDGALLLASDPYDGVAMPGGRIDLTAQDRAGTGVEPA